MTLALLSAGAAKGVVTAVQDDFYNATQCGLDASFGAVGAMKEKLEAGEPCDVIILTAALIDELAARGRVIADTRASLGRVRTGIAVRAGAPVPSIDDADALRQTLLDAVAIYVPDMQNATAGIHFASVLQKLGIARHVASHLRTFANGATAMHELAMARDDGAVGATQITEIKYTPGVTLVGALPRAFELSTAYTAAVCTSARDRKTAERFVALVTGSQSQTVRQQGGFEP